jgi:hypothetical protein
MALSGSAADALCLVELRGFEPLTPCMPLTSQPLAQQHASTRPLTSVLLSTQIAMKRHGAGYGDVRLGCWQIAGSSEIRTLFWPGRHASDALNRYVATEPATVAAKSPAGTLDCGA